MFDGSHRSARNIGARTPTREARVNDDHAGRNFTARVPNESWLADITGKRTMQSNLFVCSIKDVSFDRIVRYSNDS